MNSKLHAVCDGNGRPLVMLLSEGQMSDYKGAALMLPAMPKANRKVPRKFDRHLYKARHLIENFFARLKQYRAIATRYDKTARNFLAAVHLAASVVWLA